MHLLSEIAQVRELSLVRSYDSTKQHKVASMEMVQSELAAIFFERLFQEGSYQLEMIRHFDPIQTIPSLMKYDCLDIRFKKELKDQLLRYHISFDTYRKSVSFVSGLSKLYLSHDFSLASRINIHENDFTDFKSKTLIKMIDLARFEEKRLNVCVAFEITDQMVSQFDQFMKKKFIPAVEEARDASLRSSDEHEALLHLATPPMDYRLSFEQISADAVQFYTNTSG
ncbi:uncharacterized protein RJT20DRAFT_127373 [Scheffersomyces xylosifermentans]|uniref:uncharacterized protein n=1 Tax=Scheffersomyces xylosifermentans TaxID=1304137 RepID=UPI00315D3F44